MAIPAAPVKLRPLLSHMVGRIPAYMTIYVRSRTACENTGQRNAGPRKSNEGRSRVRSGTDLAPLSPEKGTGETPEKNTHTTAPGQTARPGSCPGINK